jgi:hypothetical protein
MVEKVSFACTGQVEHHLQQVVKVGPQRPSVNRNGLEDVEAVSDANGHNGSDCGVWYTNEFFDLVCGIAVVPE